MITKIKNWIRHKLIKFLYIDHLEELLNKEIDRNGNYFRQFKNETNAIKHEIFQLNQSVNSIQTTLENVVNIGTDVHTNQHGRSWAVVCIEGKVNIVKFIDLERRHARDILDFLKQFEAGKHTIDAPYKEYFHNGLFKF